MNIFKNVVLCVNNIGVFHFCDVCGLQIDMYYCNKCNDIYVDYSEYIHDNIVGQGMIDVENKQILNNLYYNCK